MIYRDIKAKLVELAAKFPIVTLTGPRQSGKSTLLQNAFPDYKYVSLEELDIREFAMSDPRGFLATYPDKTIIDEAQRVPQLFSYLQSHTDKQGREGMYLLAGSQNFLLTQNVDQSLAGRTAVLKLLPFSHNEMKAGGILPQSVNEEIFTGAYPRIFDKAIAPTDYYPNYIRTYVERDVRLLQNIGDLNKFEIFLKLCAGRIGQLVNLTSLATECGISVPTATRWISLLEASYICYSLQPDFNNFAKRLVKTPKLYFYDTGLACSLLGITSAEQVALHFLRGGLFENLVINEFVKKSYNSGVEGDFRFWRDSSGVEIDLIDYSNGLPTAYEIKSGATFSTDYFKNLVRWRKYANVSSDSSKVIYTGCHSFKSTEGDVISW